MSAPWRFILLLAISACRGASSPPPWDGIGQHAPDFTASTLDGREVSLGQYRGDVVVLDIWACWCRACRAELPLLDELAARHEAAGVEVLAVSIDGEREPIERIISTRPSWAVTVLHDASGKVAEAYEASSLPVAFVIDREGVIRYRTGLVDAEHARQLDSEIDKLVRGTRSAPP